MSELYWSLLMFAAVATASPGGATTLATASGAQFGFRRSVPLLVGIAVGLACLVAAAATGMATLLQALPVLEQAMKMAGSLYLLWLAFRIAGAGGPQTSKGGNAAPVRFVAGVFLLLLNPKGWAMAFGAAASFGALAADPVNLALIMGMTFGSMALISLGLWCMGGILLARLVQSERQWRVINVLLGVLLAASVVPLWLG